MMVPPLHARDKGDPMTTAGNAVGRSVIILAMAVFFTACKHNAVQGIARGSRVSSFIIGQFTPATGDPAWDKLYITMLRKDGDQAKVAQSFAKVDFQNGSAANVTLVIPQGTYDIAMNFSDTKGEVLYKVCAASSTKLYNINTPQFEASIPVCKIASQTPSGSVAVTPASEVTITPIVGDVLDSKPNSGQQQNTQKNDPVQSSSGCGLAVTETGVKNVTLQVGAQQRSMIRVVNPAFQNTHTHALVIGFHGSGLDGNSPRNDHKWPIIEELGKDEAVFVYPNAIGGTWNPYDGSGDFTFFDAIVKSIGEKYCIDKRRVIVHGFSNGSYFVNSLVAERIDAIRGVISVSGGGSGSKKAAMIIHGKSDGTIGFYPSAPNLVTSYAAANGCPLPVEFNSNSQDSCHLLDGCPNEYPVWYCPWSGNHHWPEFTLPTVWQFISSLK